MPIHFKKFFRLFFVVLGLELLPFVLNLVIEGLIFIPLLSTGIRSIEQINLLYSLQHSIGVIFTWLYLIGLNLFLYLYLYRNKFRQPVFSVTFSFILSLVLILYLSVIISSQLAVVTQLNYYLQVIIFILYSIFIFTIFPLLLCSYLIVIDQYVPLHLPKQKYPATKKSVTKRSNSSREQK